MARVLVVDDEQMDRVLLQNILEPAGHEVFLASEGEEGYKTYLKNNIEVIITDLQMPNVDGLEFIGVLEELFPDTPVIAVSGSASDLASAEGMGVSAALSKPFDPEALLAAVAEAAAGS